MHQVSGFPDDDGAAPRRLGAAPVVVEMDREVGRQQEKGFPVVGVPSTIDNDLFGTDVTIGVDTAGYGDDGTSVPPACRHLVMALVAHYYDTRQIVAPGNYGTVPKTFDTLLAACDLGIYR